MIPKAMRTELGFVAGEVTLTRDGSGVRIETVTGTGFVSEGGLLVIPASGTTIDGDSVRDLRRADQR